MKTATRELSFIQRRAGPHGHGATRACLRKGAAKLGVWLAIPKERVTGTGVELDSAVELAALIYEAASDASLWRAFLDAFTASIGARAGAMLVRDSLANAPVGFAWSALSEADLRLYTARYAAADPWYLGVARLAEGGVASGAELCSPREMEASSAFREFYAPRRLGHAMGGMILHSGSAQLTIALVRRREDGPFGSAEVHALRVLMPHLRRAVLLEGEISSLRIRLAAMTAHLDRCGHGLALIDRDRRVFYANALASELASRRDGFEIKDGRLAALTPEEDAALSVAAREIAANRASRLHRMNITRQSSPVAYRLMMLPAETSQAVALSAPHPAVAVVIIDPAHVSAPEPEALRDYFSLTAAEARIVSLLAQGLSLEELKEKLSVSVATVRTHLRNAFAKTGTSRQGELVALILRTVPQNRRRPESLSVGQ